MGGIEGDSELAGSCPDVASPAPRAHSPETPLSHELVKQAKCFGPIEARPFTDTSIGHRRAVVGRKLKDQLLERVSREP